MDIHKFPGSNKYITDELFNVMNRITTLLFFLGNSADDDDDEDDGPTEEQCQKFVTKACQKEAGRMRMLSFI